MPCKQLTIAEYNSLLLQDPNPTRHDAQGQCENFCSPCADRLPYGCDYCEVSVYAPKDYGYWTVSGGGSVTFYDPSDPENANGYNGTYEVNGTYVWDGGIYKLGTGFPYLYIGTFPYGDYSIYLYFGNSELAYSVVDGGPNPSCAPNTVTYGPGATSSLITLNGPAPSATWNIDGADKTTCEAAGGVYLPNLGYYPNPYQYSACVFHTIIPAGQDPGAYQCPSPPDPGGNFFYGGGGYIFGVITGTIYGWSNCCETPPPNQECLFEEGGGWNGICANGCKNNSGNYLPGCGPDSGKACGWVSKPYATIEECEQWRSNAIQWHQNNSDACPYIVSDPCTFYHPSAGYRAPETTWTSGPCCDGLCYPPFTVCGGGGCP